MKIVKRLLNLVSESDSFHEIVSDPMLFRDDLSSEDQRILFKKAVHLVEMEPHAICNRSCHFCPNGVLDKRKGVFEEGLHHKVINELAEIAYDRTIYYARYCEPLADSRLEDLINTARKKLPAATLKIITNGDLLTHNRLKMLADAGLDIISVSLYMPEGALWSQAAAREIIQRLADRLDLSCSFRRHHRYGVFADLAGAGLKMDVRCLDFGPGKQGFDRGGVVKDLTDTSFIRKAPCPFVFQNFTIDWNGNAMPCCNIHSDFPQHRDFVLGNIKKQSIFSVYAAKAAIQWRRSLADYQEKKEPCRHCRDAQIKQVKKHSP